MSKSDYRKKSTCQWSAQEICALVRARAAFNDEFYEPDPNAPGLWRRKHPKYLSSVWEKIQTKFEQTMASEESLTKDAEPSKTFQKRSVDTLIQKFKNLGKCYKTAKASFRSGDGVETEEIRAFKKRTYPDIMKVSVIWSDFVATIVPAVFVDTVTDNVFSGHGPPYDYTLHAHDHGT